MSRRAALPRLLAALVVAAALGANAAAAAFGLREVAPGVYVHRGAIAAWGDDAAADVANLGVVVGTRCAAVIDTGGSPAVGESLRAAVARTTSRPVCVVINTHAHPDHVLGNPAFAADRVAFAASARYGPALAARVGHDLAVLQREFGVTLDASALGAPSRVVEDTSTIDLGGRVIELRAWPTAHTDSDLSVYDRRTRTLFTGDLLFVDHLPVLDGSLSGWLRAIDRLAAMDVATAVPGHGPPRGDWPGALDAERAYLEGLRRAVRGALREGLSIQQAVLGIDTPDGGPWRLVDRFQRRNVTAAFAELEWEDEPAHPAPGVRR